MILKTSVGKSSITSVHDVKEKIEKIKEMDGMNGILPNIYILDGDMTDEEMNSLYNHPKVKLIYHSLMVKDLVDHYLKHVLVVNLLSHQGGVVT